MDPTARSGPAGSADVQPPASGPNVRLTFILSTHSFSVARQDSHVAFAAYQ